MTEEAGYRELAHTADWELEVWAPDFPALLEQAGRGMNALSGLRLLESPRQQRWLVLSAQDEESLLVAFLEELLYLAEIEGLGFDTYTLSVVSLHLDARLEGAPMLSRDKEIKAVTYHRLRITRDNNFYRVRIVFDV